jgi:hypothetical protein
MFSVELLPCRASIHVIVFSKPVGPLLVISEVEGMSKIKRIFRCMRAGEQFHGCVTWKNVSDEI